jgi:hypothetical protein
MAAANSLLPRFFGGARNSLEPTSSGVPSFGTHMDDKPVYQELPTKDPSFLSGLC